MRNLTEIERGDDVEITITDGNRTSTITATFQGERTTDNPGHVVQGHTHGVHYYLVPDGDQTVVKTNSGGELQTRGTVTDVTEA